MRCAIASKTTNTVWRPIRNAGGKAVRGMRSRTKAIPESVSGDSIEGEMLGMLLPHDGDTVVLPEFFEAYVRNVCPLFEDRGRCIDGVVFPPPAQQSIILQKMHMLSEMVHLGGERGVLMKMLMEGEDISAGILIRALHDYQELTEFIRYIVMTVVASLNG